MVTRQLSLAFMRLTDVPGRKRVPGADELAPVGGLSSLESVSIVDSRRSSSAAVGDPAPASEAQQLLLGLVGEETSLTLE